MMMMMLSREKQIGIATRPPNAILCRRNQNEDNSSRNHLMSHHKKFVTEYVTVQKKSPPKIKRFVMIIINYVQLNHFVQSSQIAVIVYTLNWFVAVAFFR